jgi:hypothetical protein
MNTIMLILWLSLPIEQPPSFQVLGVAATVKECEGAKAQLEKQAPAAKGRLSCMVVQSSLIDAGSSF